MSNKSLTTSKTALENNANATNYGTVIIENIPEIKPLKPSDPLKECIGNFGKWQLKISILMSLLKLPIAWFTLSIVFLAPPTQFWCTPPDKFANKSSEEWIEVTKENTAIRHEGLNSGFCEMVDIENDPKQTLPCVYGYSYNTSVFKSTIISEWDLVCGHQRLVDLTQITLMLGILTGNIFFGILADRRGRKNILFTCIMLQSFFGTVASWIPWYWGFVVCRFLIAVSNGGTMVTSFVMCMEVVGGKWRTVVPILYQVPFGFGNSIMAGLAYVLRDWRWFHFSLSLIASFFMVYIWCIPESPRWLLTVGRKEEALVILREAAVMNNMDPNKVEIALTDLSNVRNERETKASCAALFSTKELRKRSSLLFLNWLICGITFYAFSQYLGNIGKDIFLTVAASGLIVLPGTILCIYLVAHCGRRWAISTAHIIMALCFLSIIAIPKGSYYNDWPRICLAGIGLIGLSISMPALYLFTGELYPTVLRNAGVGVSVMFSRLGSMLAPLIISLEEVGSFVPLTILALAAILEAFLILPLPETKGTTLPETVEDLEVVQVKKSKVTGYQQVTENDLKIDHGQ